MRLLDCPTCGAPVEIEALSVPQLVSCDSCCAELMLCDDKGHAELILLDSYINPSDTSGEDIQELPVDLYFSSEEFS